MTEQKTMTRFVLFVMALVAALGFFSARAGARENPSTPEAVVASFYAWFIAHDNDRTPPLNEPAIGRYVASGTVKRLRNDYAHGGPPSDVDYFLKVQDYDAGDWAAHIAAHPAIMLNDVAVVAVTFGSKDKVGVVVFLRRQDGRWKIVKIDDTSVYD